MNVNVSTSSDLTSTDYEARANGLRAEMGATLDELRSRMTPSKLASEAASRAGLTDVSWSGAFDFASKRHPAPTALIAVGVALLIFAAARNRGRPNRLASVTSPLSESSASLVDSATQVFRERAEAKRQAFVAAAKTQVASGATKVADEIERRLESVIDRVPGGSEVRPLIESTIQIALVAALEGLLQKRSR